MRIFSDSMTFPLNLSYPCSLPEPTTSLKPDDDHNEPPSRDQLVFEYFSKRFDELFHEKCKAESKAINYMTEVRVSSISHLLA